MDVFLTGSHAYGTPRPDSDVDLAVFVSGPLLLKLRALADPAVVVPGAPPEKKKSLGQPRSADDPGDSLRFGRLNLLCFTSRAVYESWRGSTEALETRRPVSRDEAVATIKAHVRADLEKLGLLP